MKLCADYIELAIRREFLKRLRAALCQSHPNGGSMAKYADYNCAKLSA